MAKPAKVVALKRITTGYPVPERFIAQLEKLIDEARSGYITSIAYAAIGPDFASMNNAYLRGRSDRHNILGQLQVLTYEIAKQEMESE